MMCISNKFPGDLMGLSKRKHFEKHLKTLPSSVYLNFLVKLFVYFWSIFNYLFFNRENFYQEIEFTLGNFGSRQMNTFQNWLLHLLLPCDAYTYLCSPPWQNSTFPQEEQYNAFINDFS